MGTQVEQSKCKNPISAISLAETAIEHVHVPGRIGTTAQLGSAPGFLRLITNADTPNQP